MTTEWDESAYPYNADAEPGDWDYRPGPDWPPSLDEVAHRKGMTIEELMESVKEKVDAS